MILTITGCVLISAFASLVDINVGITSSRNKYLLKNYKRVIKKKKKKHAKAILLGKDKLNIIEVLISQSLIDLYISHDEFVSVNNVLREYNEIKNEIKNSEPSVEYTI